MYYITAKQLHEFKLAASTFITKIIQTSGVESVIVGVSRGGLIPAVQVSHYTELPMVPIDYSAEDGRGTSEHTGIIPSLSKYHTIFIIDDIVDTGITVKDLKEWYERKGHLVYVLSLVYKKHSCILPDCYIHECDSTEWIVFPWEKIANGKTEEIEKDEGPP